jgi:hypothetical protein
VGDTDERVVAGEESGLMRDGLQLDELIGAPGEETLAKRGERIVCDRRRSG